MLDRIDRLYMCPKCNAGRLKSDNTSLYCSSCDTYFPIRNAIPRFVPSDNYAQSFGFQWNRYRQTQLDSYVGKPISEQRLFSVTQWPRDLQGELVLEAGSGAGRFTEILAQTGATVYTCDYSSAIDANADNNRRFENVHFFQSSIFELPLPKEQFDKVICLGVLQHTPDPKKAFSCLADCVAPQGQLVIDIYAKRLTALLHMKYLFRPITRLMPQEALYNFIAKWTPKLIPSAKRLRRWLGAAGSRLLPIAEYSHLGLSPELNEQWSVLDTFDIYSPRYDRPQSMSTVRRWFESHGFAQIEVKPGLNGIVAKGIKQ